MGQTCCNYASNDPNALAVNNPNGKAIQKQAMVNVKSISPEIQETMNHAIQNEEKVIKIQAGVRGFLARKEAKGAKGGAKKSARKSARGAKKEEGEVEAKISHRSGGGRFKGGGMPERRGQDSFRNGLVYAK